MAALPELEQFDADIFQIETDSVWLGGVDGLANNQGKALANRTKWLKAQLLAAVASLGTHEAAVDPHPQYATDVSVAAALAALVNSAPATLDTLKELSDALGADANFAATMVAALALKAGLASPTFTGDPKAPTPAQFDNDTTLATTAFIQRALGSFAGYDGYNANGVLTQSVVGKLVNMTAAGAAYTLTMPATAGLPDGASFVIQNTSGRDNAIARQGTDNLTIDGSNLTSLWVRAGEAATLTKVGAYWFVSGSAALVGNASFAASLAAAGYQKLPSGLIIQWGGVTTNGSGAGSVTYPIAFPGGVARAISFAPSVNLSTTYGVNLTASSSTGFSINSNSANVGIALAVQWFALGY